MSKMSLISGFVHYNILRNMCDPKINEQNNKEIININKEDSSSSPDIEMGMGSITPQPIPKINKPITKCVHPDYWWV